LFEKVHLDILTMDEVEPNSAPPLLVALFDVKVVSEIVRAEVPDVIMPPPLVAVLLVMKQFETTTTPLLEEIDIPPDPDEPPLFCTTKLEREGTELDAVIPQSKQF
jgi:hypothetical protein